MTIPVKKDLFDDARWLIPIIIIIRGHQVEIIQPKLHTPSWSKKKRIPSITRLIPKIYLEPIFVELFNVKHFFPINHTENQIKSFYMNNFHIKKDFCLSKLSFNK